MIEELKTHATRKLELMLRYGQTHDCRRRMILDYFGDEAEVSGCHCDVCRRNNGEVVETTGPLVSDEVTTLGLPGAALGLYFVVDANGRVRSVHNEHGASSGAASPMNAAIWFNN